MKNPSQKQRVDVASEADLAVDFYDGNAIIEAFAEDRVGVDVDAFGLDLVTSQQFERIVAQMAAVTRVEHDARQQFVRV